MNTVREIVKAAGGNAVVCRAVGMTSGVAQWSRIGIPDRHWPVLLDLVPGLTLEHLYRANMKAREGRAAA